MRALFILAVAALCWADPATSTSSGVVDASNTASSLVKPVIDATLASAPDTMQYSDGGNVNWDDVQAASEDAMIQVKSAPEEPTAAEAATAEPASSSTPSSPVETAPPAATEPVATAATTAAPEATAALESAPGIVPEPSTVKATVPAPPALQKVRVVGDHLVLPPEPQQLPPPSQTAQSGFEPEFYPPRATLIPAQHAPADDGHIDPEYYRPPTPQPECVQTCASAPAPAPEEGLEPEFYPPSKGVVPETRDVVEAEEGSVTNEPVSDADGVPVEIRDSNSGCCVTNNSPAPESGAEIVTVTSTPVVPETTEQTKKPLPHEMETDDFLKAYPLTADQALLQKQRAAAAAAGSSPLARLQSRLNRVRIVPNAMQPQDALDTQT